MTVAIIGCGRIGRVHAAALRAAGGTPRLVVCDPNAEAAARAAASFGAAEWYADTSQLLAAERPNVVHVCTPPATHVPVAVRALEIGAHVLVEKPMALDSTETARLWAALRTRPGALCVDHNFLFEPEMLTARRWVAEGRIGTVFAADVFYGVDQMPGDPGPGAWAGELPGGRFTDLLPHGLYLLRHFLGELRVVSAASNGTNGAQTELRALLEGERGLGAVHVSLATVPWELGLTLRGTGGTIRVDLARQRAIITRPVTASRRSLAVARLALSTGLQTGLGAARRVTGKLTGTLRGYPGMRALITRFHANVRADLPPPVSFADGAAVATLLARIRHRLAAGGPVAVRRSA